MTVYERAIERMVELAVLMEHYAAKGAVTLYKRSTGELDTLVRDYGTVALREAVQRHTNGVMIQTPV